MTTIWPCLAGFVFGFVVFGFLFWWLRKSITAQAILLPILCVWSVSFWPFIYTAFTDPWAEMKLEDANLGLGFGITWGLMVGLPVGLALSALRIYISRHPDPR